MTNRKSRVTVRVALCVLSILGIGTGARELPAQAEATTRLRMPLWAKGGSHSPGAKPDIRVDDRLDDEDGFPNFFDTSAAAPHAAAIAALVLEANGGPGSVMPEQMRGVLQRSAFLHDLDPYQSRGKSRAPGRARVNIRLKSDGNSLISTMNPNAFEVAFLGGGSLTQLILNPEATDATAGNTTEPFITEVGFTSRPGLVFDNRAPTLGFPFTLGDLTGVMAGDIMGNLSNPAPPPAIVGNHFYTLTIDIAPGALTKQ